MKTTLQLITADLEKQALLRETTGASKPVPDGESEEESQSALYENVKHSGRWGRMGARLSVRGIESKDFSFKAYRYSTRIYTPARTIIYI